jgi:hypothetical protein
MRDCLGGGGQQEMGGEKERILQGEEDGSMLLIYMYMRTA